MEMEELDVQEIRTHSVHGVVALVSRTFVLNLVSFVASLVIYTALSPVDVGIYVVIIAMQRIISFFTDFGLGAALVQKKEALTQEDISTTFTIQFLLTGGIFLLVVLLQGYIGSFFKLNFDAMMLLVVLVFTIFLSSFKTIPSILLERKIHFHKLILPQIVEALLFNILLVILLLTKHSLSSFTVAFLVASLASIPFYYYVSPWKIRFGINKKAMHHLRFGVAFQAKNILATIKDDFLTVFLSKVMSYADLGFLGFAQRNAFFSFRYVVDSVTKVSFSTYSRVQDDKKLLKSAIEKSLYFVGTLMFPITVGAILIMPYVILYFPKWHNKWEPALFSFVFFSLNALVSSFSNILVSVLDSTGRVKTTLKLMVVWTSLTWILTPLLLLFFGYNGVAIASFVVTFTIIYTIYLVKKIVDFEFLPTIMHPAIASIIMGIVVFLVAKIFVTSLLTLSLVVALGIGIYGGVMYMIARKKFEEGIKILLKR